MKFYIFKIERVFSKSGRKFIMATEPDELKAFIGITEEKMSKLLDLIDDSIVRDQMHSPIRQKVTDLGYTFEESGEIVTAFFNFYVNASDPLIIKIIDNSTLSSNEKIIVKNAFETISKKADKDKISAMSEAYDLKDYGHSHVHNLKVQLELRPISKQDAITKLVPSIVVTGELHDGDHENVPTSLNFQLSLASFESLLSTFNNKSKEIKTQIAQLKTKMGEDIVG